MDPRLQPEHIGGTPHAEFDMTPIQPGQRVPEVTLRLPGRTVTTRELFADKKVVLFGLPGAFTPTCSSSHVPRYDELAPTFFANGVDDIVCVSVNDDFVMKAWGRAQGVEHVTLLADGNGTLTDALGLLVDKDGLGFGKRSWRYALVVVDGVVDQAFIEPVVEGDPYEVSDADTVLRAVAPDAVVHDIVLVTKPGCKYCVRARKALDEAGLAYEEVASSPRRLRAMSGRVTTPQVFIDGVALGGSDELLTWLAER